MSEFYKDLLEKSKETYFTNSYSEFASNVIQEFEVCYAFFIFSEIKNRILAESTNSDFSSDNDNSDQGKQNKKKGKIIDVTDD
jgi:hypothetical protein